MKIFDQVEFLIDDPKQGVKKGYTGTVVEFTQGKGLSALVEIDDVYSQDMADSVVFAKIPDLKITHEYNGEFED